MRNNIIITMIVLCIIAAISSARENSYSIDMLQNALFGVSTLKGVGQVYPQVMMEVIKEGETELDTTSEIESLQRNELAELVNRELTDAGIKIAETYEMTSTSSPLSLNVTVFIYEISNSPANYVVYIYTEALQYVALSRDDSIRSLSRTWPMQPMGLFNRNMLKLNSQTLEQGVKDELDKQMGYFIRDFVAANPKPAGRSAEGVDIEALKAILFEEAPDLIGTFRVRDENPQLQAINQLNAAGSDEAVGVLLEFLTDNKVDCKLKHYSLTALGQIGTEAAIEAITKFEDWSRGRYTQPLPFEMDAEGSPIDHIRTGPVIPLAQTTDSENKTWMLVPLSRNGIETDICITSLDENGRWTPPVVLDLPDFPALRFATETSWDIQCRFQVEGDSLIIECNDKIYEIKISDHLKDTDNDGIVDIVEVKLLTDPNNPDSDGDGVIDGTDSNPLTPKHEETNDVTEIRQAVFSALFATTNSKSAIVIVDRDEFAKQEYYGFGGPVLRAPQSRSGFVNVTSINIRYQSEDAATVTIGDWEGNMAASTHEAKLEKKHGKWVIVEFRLTGIA